MKPQIVFFGTGPVSLNCLEGIYDVFEIEAIITKPDRIAPSGSAHEHPVKLWGQTQGIAVHQVADKRALEALSKRQRFQSQVGLVVDFGMIIPEPVIEAFPLGIVNSHFSLLPALRGADPITFAILEGLNETGVSLMKIVAAMDEGDLIAQLPHRLLPDITTPELTAELGDVSNLLLREKLPKYIMNDIKPWEQDVNKTKPTYTRRLTKADGLIDWTKPAAQLEREVRAFIGWPGSRTRLLSREVTLTAVRVIDPAELEDTTAAKAKPGTPLQVWPDRLVVATGEDTLEILQLKPAGKREMATAEFLRGLK